MDRPRLYYNISYTFITLKCDVHDGGTVYNLGKDTRLTVQEFVNLKKTINYARAPCPFILRNKPRICWPTFVNIFFSNGIEFCVWTSVHFAFWLQCRVRDMPHFSFIIETFCYEFWKVVENGQILLGRIFGKGNSGIVTNSFID